MEFEDKHDFNQRLAQFLHNAINNTGGFSIPTLYGQIELFDHYERENLLKLEAEKQAREDAETRTQYEKDCEHRAWLHRNLPKGVLLSSNELHGPWQVVVVNPDGYSDDWYLAKTDGLFTDPEFKHNQFLYAASGKRKNGLDKALAKASALNRKLGYEQDNLY
jgi:hypothetical protein